MTNRQEKLAELWEKVREVRVAMMTTRSASDDLQSRPMFTQEADFTGGIYFFTGRDSDKMHNIRHNDRVNLAYASPDDNLYVSVTGTARVVEDRSKVRDLWNPMNKVFFPDGVDDPNLLLLEIVPASAELWDSPAGKVRQLFNVVKAAVTGEHEDLGENRTYDL